MARKSRILYLLPLFLGLAAHSAHAEETFPFPEALQPDVDFWVSIFTHYGTDEGVLHDNRNLAVVYERIDMPSGISRQERNRRVKKRRDALIRVLQRLADGKRDNLSAEEAAMLKYASTEMQCKTIDQCLQLFGGYGYTAEYPISRFYTDARIQRIYGGTSEIMRELVARSILGR